jgi:hypothetical protein
MEDFLNVVELLVLVSLFVFSLFLLLQLMFAVTGACFALRRCIHKTEAFLDNEDIKQNLVDILSTAISRGLEKTLKKLSDELTGEKKEEESNAQPQQR